MNNAINTPCIICGDTHFIPGPFGRVARNGALPKCANCGSLERHRIVRLIYNAIPQEILCSARALQFSDDPASPEERFQSLEISQFGVENSLDMASIDRDSAAYDWVIANHVLEHIDDDFAAMREMLRILNEDGTLQLTVPTPATELVTRNISNTTDNYHHHRRSYGSDLPLRFSDLLCGCSGLQVVGFDKSTERWDVVYLFLKSQSNLQVIGKALLKAGLPTLRCM